MSPGIRELFPFKRRFPIIAAIGIGLVGLGLCVHFGMNGIWRRPVASVVLQFDLSKVKAQERPEMWKFAIDRIDRRARQMGGEYTIRDLGNERVRVQVFGRTKIGTAEVGKFLTGPRLEFRLLHPEFANLRKPPTKSEVPAGYDLMEMRTEDEFRHPISVYSAVRRTPEMANDDIAYAAAEDDHSGGYQIRIHFTKTGGQHFAEVTEANINRQLAIVLDERIYSAPKIMDRISSGTATINGKFTQREAIELSNVLNNPFQIPAKVVKE